MYIDTGSPVPNIPSKSRGLAVKNEKILTEWKLFKTSVFVSHVAMKTNSAIDSLFDVDLNGLSVERWLIIWEPSSLFCKFEWTAPKIKVD